ncbi:MAG: hypothetical protein J7601_09840 [Chloroflexi bacterium]|jgi:hypothetical protein|nr:hypothetical protein [Chloroflexota bacterium]
MINSPAPVAQCAGRRDALSTFGNRLLTLIALLALMPVLLLVVELPTRIISLNFLGSPLSITLSADTLLIVFLPALTVAGADWILREHPEVQSGRIAFLFPFWVTPGLVALALAILLTRLTTWAGWLAALIGGSVALGMLLLAIYRSLAPEISPEAPARVVVAGMGYVIAFALFTLIYSTRERSAITATATFLASAALAIDLLAPRSLRDLRRAAPYALIAGWLTGQAIWALNYCNLSQWSAGTLLLVIFYAAVGIAQQHLLGKLTRSVLMEFAIVSVIALLIAWRLADVR